MTLERIDKVGVLKLFANMTGIYQNHNQSGIQPSVQKSNFLKPSRICNATRLDYDMIWFKGNHLNQTFHQVV